MFGAQLFKNLLRTLRKRHSTSAAGPSLFYLDAPGARSSSQPLASLQSEYTILPGTLNAILAQVGDVFLLPLTTPNPRARLLDRELGSVGIYTIIYHTVIRQQADAIFFVNKESPLQLG